MCGIAGIINSSKDPECLISIGENMVNQLQHRGPDGNGIKILKSKKSGNLLLVHTRLSIIDLSDRASQPMSSNDKSVWITFNGEIYNYQEIREDLVAKGFVFTTDSDTEVIINAYKEWGIECFQRFIGMWALALWDQDKDRLILSRDRLGIKPLYYSFEGRSLLFGSEPKVIVDQIPATRKLNLKALSDYLSYRYVLDGSSFFSGIEAVSAGTNIIFENGNIIKEKFWDLPVVSDKENIEEANARENLEDLMYSSVKYRMISDVPVGSFLSGGLDSSILVALMSEIHTDPIKTFTIGFNDDGYNEFDYARLVSDHCKTDHKEILLDASAYLESLKSMIMIKDSPLAVPNEIALHELSKVLKKDITVVLSGEGADELFGGYGRIFRSAYDFQRVMESGEDGISKELEKNLLEKYTHLNFKSEIDHFLSQYSYIDFNEKSNLLVEDMNKQLGLDPHNRNYFLNFWDQLDGLDLHEKYMWIFQRVHLEGLLGRLDSATMSASVEGRVPFVDHRLIEEINALPLKYKMRWLDKDSKQEAFSLNSNQISENNDITKYILRTQFEGRLPKGISERKKIGFPVPLTNWLSGPLRDYASDRLLDTKAKTKPIFNQITIKSIIENAEKDPKAGLKIWMLTNVEEWMRIYDVSV